MALPTILGGRTPIVDEEMGYIQDPADEHAMPQPSASQDAQPDLAVNSADVEMNANSAQSSSNNSSEIPSDPNLRLHNPSQLATPAVVHPPPTSSEPPHATGAGMLRKRGHESEPEQEESSHRRTLHRADRATTGADDMIEEIDEFGIRTKVRLTVNEAEARQRIQERDAVVAQRDAIARERADLMRKVEQTEHALRSAVAQKDSLQHELARASQQLKEATRTTHHLQGQLDKVKAEAHNQITTLKEQVNTLKGRMAAAATDHANRMKEWDERRVGREREVSEKHQQLQMEVEGLNNQLKEITAQMQQLNERHVAQMQENDQLRRQRAEIETANAASIQPVVEANRSLRPDLQQSGAPSADNTPRRPHTNVFGPIPVHQHARSQLLTSHSHVERPSSQPAREQPIRPPQIDQRATDPPLNRWAASNSSTINTARAPPVTPGPVLVHRQVEDQRLNSHPIVYPSLPHSPPVEPPGAYNQSRHSPPHIPAIQPSEMSNLRRRIPDNVPPNLPSPDPVGEPSSEDIRMRDEADEGDEADTEDSDVPGLPDLVDRKALKPRRRKNQIANKGPLLQRQAQRQIETIAPPGGYPRARVANALLGRLHYPASSPSWAESPVIQRSLFESAQSPGYRSTSARIFSNGQPATTSPLRPLRQFKTQMRSRERSPLIDPPGSIFGRHDLPPTSDRLTSDPHQRASPSGLFSDRTLRDRHASRHTSHAASGRSHPLKEATPESYTRDSGGYGRRPEEYDRARGPGGGGHSPEEYDRGSERYGHGYGRGPERHDRGPERNTRRAEGYGDSPRDQGVPARGHDNYARSPRADPRGPGNMTVGESATEIAAIVTSSIRDLIATRVNEELRSQGMLNTPRNKGNKHYPFRSPIKLRPRTQARQDLMKLGLTEMHRLLEIEEDDDIVRTVGRHTASWKELEDYELRGKLPILEPLRIAWDDPQTKWNWELAAIFQSNFVERHPAYQGREEEIREYFIQRIVTLRKKLNDMMVGEDESKEEATARVAMQYEKEARAKRKRTRRKKRCDDRLETCRIAAERDPMYDDLYRVVDRYGPDGMSSDDTDGETYSVRIMPWRPTEMVDTMDHLDGLRDRLGVYGNRRPGGLPRPRERRVTQAESEREAPATLPRNLYRRGWLNGLSQFELARLDPDEDIPFPVLEDAIQYI